MTFNQSILDALPPLASGSHSGSATAVCAMEALARACGLGTTDHPECASPVVGAFCRALNDSLPNDELRDELIRPLLPLMVGTAGDGHDQERAFLAADRAVRGFAADALAAAGLADEAAKLRALKPIRDAKTADSAARTARTAASAALAADSAARTAASVRSAVFSAASMRSAAALASYSARSARMAASAASAASAAYSAARSESWNEAAESLRDLCMVGR